MLSFHRSTGAVTLAAGTWIVLLITAIGPAACTTPASPPAGAPKAFVGSAACESCHQDIYTRWKRTLMANVIVDPATRPDVVLGDFSTPNPLVTFRKEDVAFVYGTKWK
jgi:hypothetical protein